MSTKTQNELDDLLTRTLKAQGAMRLAELEFNRLRAVATNLEADFKLALIDGGIKKFSSDEHALDVSVVTRRDVRIADVTEFAAALMEAGMAMPMTEPKPDIGACKKVAKSFPDMPGVEPIETSYLKWNGHRS